MNEELEEEWRTLLNRGENVYVSSPLGLRSLVEDVGIDLTDGGVVMLGLAGGRRVKAELVTVVEPDLGDDFPQIRRAVVSEQATGVAGKLEEGWVAVPQEKPPEDGGKTLADVFAEWFYGFNTGSGKVRPDPGTISLGETVMLCRQRGADVLEVLSRVSCGTRHMHAEPHQLPPTWATSGAFVIELDPPEQARARSRSNPDAPQNWFAVETEASEVYALLGLSPLAAEASAAPPPFTPPPPATIHASEPRANDEVLSELARDCPEGYMITLERDGFHAIWYGPAAQSPAQAMADAWRHSTNQGQRR